MSYQEHLSRPVVFAAHGMASTGHPLASQAALGVLQRGGSAMDAAVAASAVLAVVDPAASGIGGDGFYTYFDAASGRLEVLNGCGRTGRSTDPGRFVAGIPASGPLSATVPGLVLAWEDALARHGRRTLAELLATAVYYAKHGFPVSTRVAAAFRRKAELLDRYPAARQAYRPRGDWPRPGEILCLPDLARGLEDIARDGAAVFYTGWIAEAIAGGLGADGGMLALDDFAEHRSDIGAPLMGSYRGYDVAVQQPPTMASLLLQQLKLVEAMGAASPDWDAPDFVHLMIEAKKASFADMDAYLTDPTHSGRAPAEFLDPAYIAERSRALSLQTAARYRPGSGSRLGHTTYLAVADRDGNLVSWIQSVFGEFGSCWMAPGTGFVLNNRMYGFSADPGHINRLAPGKRTAHTLLAPMLLKQGRPVMALGTPGDYGQTQSNLQMITHFVDHGMDVQQMIDAPRWRSLEDLDVAIESRFAAATIGELGRRGHRMKPVQAWTDLMGGAQAIAIDPHSGCFMGAADPRREGCAIGW
ncbi:gamma-glutamyltransferase [Pigmentiphaga soli]|uniref:Glutathione hydrolase proenzyme n=1 Tax=Pigmentiphaga soli TaxID=1007095 RepID=A0ABP8GFT8_9BURK